MNDDAEFTARLAAAREREADHRRQEAERRRKHNLPDPPDAETLREEQRRARTAHKEAAREAKEAWKREKIALKLEQQRVRAAVRTFIAHCRDARIKPQKFQIGTTRVGGAETGYAKPVYRRGWRYRQGAPQWWISTRRKMHKVHHNPAPDRYEPGGDDLEADNAASLRALVDQHIADMVTFIAENEGRPPDRFFR